MSMVSVREFSYNPSAMFARVEQGETIEVTRRGKVVAVLVPGPGGLGEYGALVADGLIRLAPATTDDLDDFPRITVPDDVDPVEVLLAMRADER